MRAWVSSVRALPMTFVIYLIEAAFASVSSLPAVLEFTGSAPRGRDASAQAQWLEYLVGPDFAPRGCVLGLLSLLVLCLLSPWLQIGDGSVHSHSGESSWGPRCLGERGCWGARAW